MDDSLRPDQLVVKTHHLGDDAQLTPGDRRIVQIDPEGVTITRGLRNQFPMPAQMEAKELLEAIFVAHAESDGPTLVSRCERFRVNYGWHPRAEWYRVLGLEILNAPDLIEQQTELLANYYQCLAGLPPEPTCPLTEPLSREVLEWALGANHLNLMEWLWKRGEYEGVKDNFEASLLGLSANDDNGRRIERLLYRASSESRLGQGSAAQETVREAQDLDPTEFKEVWKLYAAKMPELAAYAGE